MLAVLFFAMVAMGVPVGFVLATIGITCVQAMGSADMIAVVMNAQRGSGGFIFLALPFFILAGFIMDRADVGGRIVEFVGSLIGHVRGGLLQVMIVGVYISSCISGSKAADMATVGLPMNRKLEEHGYAPEERAAILAASAAMAESVPPSIALILLGSATAISTGALFIAGVLPAAVIGVMLMVTVRVRATFADWKPTPKASRSEIIRTGRLAFMPLMIPVILIGGIVGGIGTPTEVSTFAVLYSLALGLAYRKITLRNFWSSLTSASLLNGMIFYTVSAATIFSWALTLEGVTTAIAATVAGLGATAFLPAVIVITILMGTMLESFVTIIILAPLLLPVAQQFGIDQLQYGIIMTEAFGIGIILPPIGIALYVACAISGAQIEKASKPLLWYLPVLMAGLLLVTLRAGDHDHPAHVAELQVLVRLVPSTPQTRAMPNLQQASHKAPSRWPSHRQQWVKTPDGSISQSGNGATPRAGRSFLCTGSPSRICLSFRNSRASLAEAIASLPTICAVTASRRSRSIPRSTTKAGAGRTNSGRHRRREREQADPGRLVARRTGAPPISDPLWRSPRRRTPFRLDASLRRSDGAGPGIARQHRGPPGHPRQAHRCPYRIPARMLSSPAAGR